MRGAGGGGLVVSDDDVWTRSFLIVTFEFTAKFGGLMGCFVYSGTRLLHS